MDRRGGPKHIRHKTSLGLETQIVAIRKMTPCYGAKRLKYFFDLSPSVGAIQRIIHDRGLTRKRRHRYQKRTILELSRPSTRHANTCKWI